MDIRIYKPTIIYYERAGCNRASPKDQGMLPNMHTDESYALKIRIEIAEKGFPDLKASHAWLTVTDSIEKCLTDYQDTKKAYKKSLKTTQEQINLASIRRPGPAYNTNNNMLRKIMANRFPDSVSNFNGILYIQNRCSHTTCPADFIDRYYAIIADAIDAAKRNR